MAADDVRLYPHPIIAREGWPFVGLTVGLALVATWLDWTVIAVLLWLVAVFVIQFFRDPARTPPVGEGLITSPADGRIVVVGKAADPMTGQECLKISVFMNVFNVHSNRAPIQGRVMDVQYFPGAFFNAAIDKASEQNERSAMVIEDPQGRRLTCIQIAGLVARRILCYVKPGDSLLRGARYGFIRFGSRVDVYCPSGTQALVSVGDKVYAHSTALARW
ncbi:MAG: phosphatidylserine decarboxylase [Betaproteobacteria bacterium]|jgi:phosphatidylserine decarboxylase|nr:phosphatidylserine decarboxylase [Betaproteobacteria bacterium]